MKKPKLIRITTVPQSLRGLLKGQMRLMKENGFDVIGVSSPGDALKEVEDNEGVRTVAIEMTRSITPLKDIKALIQLIRLFRKEKPEIVHTHTPKAGLLGMMAAKVIGVPHRLHTVAGMPLTVATGMKRKLLNSIERLTYACATKVYPNSFGLREIILENNFTSENKLKVLGKGSSNGIDTSFFNPEAITPQVKTGLKKELGVNDNDFIYLFVGRVVADKGINELIAAFDKVNEVNPNTYLVLVGGIYDNDPVSEKSLHSIKNNPNIKSVGSQRDVLTYYSIADVFVFPSYREGFPNVVMEACAMEIPVIATNINGCNEIIQDSVNGVIIEPEDEKSLELAMNRLLIDSSFRMKLKSNTREMIKVNYERSFIQQEILSEYKRLLAN